MATPGILATSSDIYTFVSGLLGNVDLDQTIFQTYLGVAQLTREMERDWIILKKQDTTQVANSGDLFTTSKALPTDFLKFSGKFPVKLVDVVANPTQIFYYRQIPIENRLEYQFDSTRFYCDYGNFLLYLCGQNLDRQWTIVQDYIKKPADMIYDPSGKNSTGWAPFTNWPIANAAMAMLGYDIAAMHELGADYDDVNARMGNANVQKAAQMMAGLIRWDGKLAKDAAAGREFRSPREPVFRDKSIFPY